MNEAPVETLFDEFTLAYRRGERPDVGEYLARAPEGPERDDLAGLLDRFLQAAPAREPSEEEIVLMQARLEQEAGLLVLRRRRALKREAVVDALVRALRLDPEKRAKVWGYYHELEVGNLPPEPVHRSVWEALSEILGANARALASGPRGVQLAAAPAYRRKDEGFVLELRETAMAQPDEGTDEIDRLLTGAS